MLDPLKADLLLLLTAAIWGFAFVAQRVGMSHMGPFSFNAIRFSLGAASLIPFLVWGRKPKTGRSKLSLKNILLPGILTGLVLFGGASLQQFGLVGTSAGKAGFITGLYVILAPLLGLLWGRKAHLAHWAGATLAVAGLYFLSVRENLTISGYDLVILAGAFLWAVHVQMIAQFSDAVGPLWLSAIQFAVCGLLSGAAAFAFEGIALTNLQDGLWTILYGSFLSVGLAYTLQVVAQRTADPAHAVVILSLEGAFAALGGWLVLGETLSLRDLLGSGLILIGILVSQLFGAIRKMPSGDELY
jgi:drug/metabolite transporter (DMT)-like permease